MTYNQLRDEVHQANVESGWWTDLETGQSILKTRNRPEMLCLSTSEICEAVIDGFQPDSHLPQFPAFHMEMADTAIRLLDLAGADNIDLDSGDAHRIAFVGETMQDAMALVILLSSYALEGVRKGNTELYHKSVADAFRSLYTLANLYKFDLDKCIQAKLTYNKNRADHKIENRKAKGGKKI